MDWKWGAFDRYGGVERQMHGDELLEVWKEIAYRCSDSSVGNHISEWKTVLVKHLTWIGSLLGSTSCS